jgi:glycosyltransferase A (GT-A) superfamily protein (DUF2064 family)
MSRNVALAIVAKTPVPGRVKTRLCPPCSPEQAALLAEAALRDSLQAMSETVAARRVVLLDGEIPPWLGPEFDVICQRGRGLAERLANGFVDIAQPTLLIGMDTPQVPHWLLQWGVALLSEGEPCVIGDSEDGGYWAIGLADPDPRVFSGVPMSQPTTGLMQRRRAHELGLRPADLPPLLDVDDISSARQVAKLAPSSRFAKQLRELEPVLEPIAA